MELLKLSTTFDASTRQSWFVTRPFPAYWRVLPYVLQLRSIRSVLVESLRAVAEWIGARASSAAFPRAVALYSTQLVPFFEACLRAHFPYANIAAIYGFAHVSRTEYVSLR